MEESQNIEFKRDWHDEYIKWICGFTNANGGKLIIGIDDKGVLFGVTDAKKLLEDIPNKVRDILGITIEVNLKTKQGKQILEIKVEPYPHPVSYRGQYHYRSGSTKQELKGSALDKFILRKQGKHWDGVPVPKVAVKDLSKTTFDSFKKKAFQSQRLEASILKESNNLLLDNLRLTDGKYLKRGAILLFHPDPEKYVTGAYVKIGFFRTDDDLLFQDTIHGNLFEQLDKAMDLLLTKYLKAFIRYEGIQRIEEYPFPEPALREAMVNAIAHKDYSSGNPIQISVYEDKIIFWNSGQLPENWTLKNIINKHSSEPFNPQISNAFFRAGLIEAWGRGTIKIINECKKYQIPAPIFKFEPSGFWLEMNNPAIKVSEKVSGKVSGKMSGKMSGKVSGKVSGKILLCVQENEEITIPELAIKIGVAERTIERNLQTLQKNNKLKRIGGAKGGHWKILMDEK